MSTQSKRIMGHVECRHCKRQFLKGEHLRRHELTHTGSKPFRCRNCKRAFARQDSLLRHERLHNRALESDSPQSLQDLPLTPNSQNTVREHEDSVTRPPVTNSIAAASITCPPDPVLAVSNGQGLCHGDFDFDLIWPDTEDLFQSLTSFEPQGPFNIDSLWSGPPTSIFHTDPSSFKPQQPSISSIPSGANHQAVNDVSRMITGLSASVTAAVEANSITSVFLDECLHMFFMRFIPTFPILHRSTFVFKDCMQPLLLNAIAIGSLYLGPKNAVAKGEVLWRLSHTAVATSWQSLLTHRGPYDTCPGVQLVITSLLGQLYGALSRNKSIRTTSQAFHSLCFYWARHCGMFDANPFTAEDVPNINAPQAEKEHRWKTWVSREIQQRSILALYMLDGLVSQMTSKPTSERHTLNPINLLTSENSFMAESADEWIQTLFTIPSPQPTFRSLFHQMFSPTQSFLSIDSSCSGFSLRVLLEGIQSMVMDRNSSESAGVGVPEKQDIARALCRAYHCINTNTSIIAEERSEILLRWHSICIEAITKSSDLCKALCSRYGIEQYVWSDLQATTHSNEPSLAVWSSSNDARRALLHAAAIQDIVEQLPRGRAHAIHMPIALFTAATVFGVFSLSGLVSMRLPNTVDWKRVADDTDLSWDAETARFIRGEALLQSPSRNLLYELNSTQKLFRCLATQWGVSADMEAVVGQLIEFCHL